jgi:dolichol-phosphate mannosyltransferase
MGRNLQGKGGMLLSVVFSFRNEEAVLDELIRRVTAAVEPLDADLELIFVNDDSTDRSLEILERHRRADPRVRIITMSRRFGVHPCTMAGLRHARGEAVIYMDADLQDPPELIPELVARYRAGAEVVHTRRTKRLGEGFFKLWVTRRAYGVINALSDIGLEPEVGDFKLLARRVVDELVRLEEADPFMRGLVRWVGFRQETVPYTREARHAGATHFRLLGGGPVREFLRGVTSFSAAPLYFAVILGLLVVLVSAGLTVYVLAVWRMGLAVPGWAGPMVAVSFLNGTVLLTNGLTALYVARIHDAVNRRPLYIIRSKAGFDDEDRGAGGRAS